MLGRIRRTIQSLIDVYRGWRVVLVMGVVIPILALAALLPERIRVGAALLLGLSLGSLLVLHGLDVRRQDRLRSQLPRVVAPIEQQSHELKPTRKEAPDSWTARITVVVTAHNESSLLLTCLESVANQTWTDFECIVVDDLSTDNTLNDAIAEFKGDDRFRFVHNRTNQGLAGSRNVGLTLANGQWVTFLDADDFLYEDALAARVDAISKHQSDSTVAGAYCGWHSVDEDSEYRGDAPPAPKNRDHVMWFDAAFDAPFIASAPLIGTRIAQALGGFDDSVPTAEDYEFWARLLRQGFVVLWAPVTGVAYRQRRNSMYRNTTSAHAEITSSVYQRNQTRLRDDVEQIGPFLFREPAHVYQTSLAMNRRLLTAYVAAEAVEDRESAEALWSDLSRTAEPWMRWAVSENILSDTALRIESYQSDGAHARASLLDHRLRPRVRHMLSGGSQAPLNTSASRMREPSDSLQLAPISLSRGIPEDWSGDTVLLMPSAAYHCDELGPLAIGLAARGVPVGFGVIPKRFGTVKAELQKYGVPVAILDPEEGDAEEAVSVVAAVVTLNDWGDYDRFVDEGNAVGIPTFGKVEGVQDFTDADVSWDRGAYQRVQNVLCQGRNDFDATSGDRSIVGSTRLERIWNQSPVGSNNRIVVINLNFTYGVLSKARDAWLDSAIEACRRQNLRWTVSLHPAQAPPEGLGNIASKPMRHLLAGPSILISRFSTVPYEAMARGVPFVYHNPHEEQVPTFQEPDGAFEVTTTTSELAEALGQAHKEQDYRSRCEGFFKLQIDIEKGKPSEVRTVEVIAAAVSS